MLDFDNLSIAAGPPAFDHCAGGQGGSMHDQLYAFRLHHGLFKDLIDTQYQPVCGTIEGGQLLHGVVGAIVLKNEFRKVAPDIDGR